MSQIANHNNCLEFLIHPTYSSDLVPSDFNYFNDWWRMSKKAFQTQWYENWYAAGVRSIESFPVLHTKRNMWHIIGTNISNSMILMCKMVVCLIFLLLLEPWIKVINKTRNTDYKEYFWDVTGILCFRVYGITSYMIVILANMFSDEESIVQYSHRVWAIHKICNAD
jgi:hypothetical protein